MSCCKEFLCISKNKKSQIFTYKSIYFLSVDFHTMAHYGTERYKKFLKTAAYLLPNKCISPTREIDLIWHIHMTFIDNYCYECKYFANGYVLGHNDTNADNMAEDDCFNHGMYQEMINHESKLLINGYVRINITSLEIVIPPELIALLVEYYFVAPKEVITPESSYVYCSIMIWSQKDTYCLTY